LKPRNNSPAGLSGLYDRRGWGDATADDVIRCWRFRSLSTIEAIVRLVPSLEKLEAKKLVPHRFDGFLRHAVHEAEFSCRLAESQAVSEMLGAIEARGSYQTAHLFVGALWWFFRRSGDSVAMNQASSLIRVKRFRARAARQNPPPTPPEGFIRLIIGTEYGPLERIGPGRLRASPNDPAAKSHPRHRRVAGDIRTRRVFQTIAVDVAREATSSPHWALIAKLSGEFSARWETEESIKRLIRRHRRSLAADVFRARNEIESLRVPLVSSWAQAELDACAARVERLRGCWGILSHPTGVRQWHPPARFVDLPQPPARPPDKSEAEWLESWFYHCLQEGLVRRFD
jgi:hypothetical protein